MEDVVEAVLKKMMEEGKILNFMRHRFRQEREEGKDFTFSARVGRNRVDVPFGVTVSQYQGELNKIRYPGMAQFCWPVGTNPWTIEDRLIELINKNTVRISCPQTPQTNKALMYKTA